MFNVLSVNRFTVYEKNSESLKERGIRKMVGDLFGFWNWTDFKFLS